MDAKTLFNSSDLSFEVSGFVMTAASNAGDTVGKANIGTTEFFQVMETTLLDMLDNADDYPLSAEGRAVILGNVSDSTVTEVQTNASYTVCNKAPLLREGHGQYTAMVRTSKGTEAVTVIAASAMCAKEILLRKGYIEVLWVL